MVYQKYGLGLSYALIADNLNVNQSTVKHTVGLFNTTVNVAKKPCDKSGLPRKVTKVVKVVQILSFNWCCNAMELY